MALCGVGGHACPGLDTESKTSMNFGATARKSLTIAAMLAAALTLSALPQTAAAQVAAPVAEAVTPEVAPVVEPLAAPAPAAAEAVVEAAPAAPAFDHYGADMIKGQPVNGAIDFQPQYTDTGEYAYGMHTYLLMPVITVISLFVLGLLLWVVARYNRRANAVASKTSHNTLIEVVWTVIPVLILVVIAVPSITLLARQYEPPPEDAITIKATGYQWNWGYTYPDNGGFEVISNMLKEEGDATLRPGERVRTNDDGPAQLAVDNRMVVPVGVPIRLQTIGSDVIHAFGVPSLWFKMDAVPGRINEKVLIINEPGIYYGQCMELCGARHGYMPIAVEARPLAEFEAWVRSKGGKTRAELAAEAAAAAAAPAAAAPVAEAAATDAAVPAAAE